MLAIAAAIVFGFALLLDLLDTNLGAPDLFNFPRRCCDRPAAALAVPGRHRQRPAHGGTGSGRRFYGRRPGRG